MGETEFWVAVAKIIWINILLSGDNAVVIALACRGLPHRQRLWGMVLGAGVAVGAAHRVHRRGRLADAAALSQDRRRAGAVLDRRQAAGSRRAGRERDRGGRASLARGAHRRHRRYRHEPRQRHRHRGGGRRQHGAAGARARRQHSDDGRRRALIMALLERFPILVWARRRAARLDRRRGDRDRSGGDGLSDPAHYGVAAARIGRHMARRRPALCWC